MRVMKLSILDVNKQSIQIDKFADKPVETDYIQEFLEEVTQLQSIEGIS